MTTFKQYLTELFDSGKTTDLDWEIDDDIISAKFNAESRKYTVDFHRKANQVDWEVKFALMSFFDSKHYQLTKTGNEFKVFAAVIAAIKKFLADEQPKTLYFVGDKIDKDRIQLYEKLLKMFSNDITKSGYKVRSQSGDTIKFIISK